MNKPLWLILFFASSAGLFGSCSGFHQPGYDISHIYSRVYRTDYNTAWQAVLESIKSYDRTVVNRQGGVVQTAWTDNSDQKSFTDSFGESETYLKSRYRFLITVAPGNYNGKPSVKVSVQKEVLVQRDMLEGWKPVETDAITENTILYRIGRIVYIKLKLKQIEEEKTKQLLEEESA